MSRMNHVNTREEVIEAFRVFDKGQTGYIARYDLQSILTELGDYMDPNEIEELLNEADYNRDGNIRYEDFVNQLFSFDL